MPKKYRKFTEVNEWEGETWNFYIPIEGNEEAISKFEKQIKAATAYAEANNQDMPYSLDEKVYTGTEVNTLVTNAEVGYMADHESLHGVFKPPRIPAKITEESFEKLMDKLYKGGITNCVKKKRK